MGGPWTIRTESPFIVADDWGPFLRVQYGDPSWPSHSFRKWFWEAE
jgi:hypothetical protein